MKKLLLTLIVSIALCGSVFAQFPYESHWPDFQYIWGGQSGICAAVAIDGHIYTVDDEGWDALEVAFFVGDEQRGNNGFLNRENVDEWGDPYPITNATAIGYDNPNEVVSFKMWDHINGILYEECEVTYLDEPMTITTGPDYFQALLDEPYLPIILWFTSPATENITRVIDDWNTTSWYLIANPLTDVVDPSTTTVTGMTADDSFDLYRFNQSAAANEDGISLEWENWKAEGTENYHFALEPLKGYLYAHETGVTLSFSGNTVPQDQVVEIALDYDESDNVEFKGVNLLGNPFGVTAYADRDFYVMNGEDIATDPVADKSLVAIEGAFFYAEGPGETVHFQTTPFSKGAVFALNLSDNGKVIDRAAVRLGEGSQLPKFQLNSNHTKLYIPVDNKDYAIVRSEGMGELPVNFKAENNGTYSLTLSSKDVEFSYLHLIDNLTGADQDLLVNPSYSFNASTTDYASRFRLVFATGNDEDNFAFFSNGSLVVNNEGNATLQVVDVTGRIIKCESINGCANVSIDAAPGVYMVRLVNGDNVKVQKVVK